MYVGEAEIKEGILFTLHGSGRWIRSSPLELSAHSQLVMLTGDRNSSLIRNIHGFWKYFLTCFQVPLLSFPKRGGNRWKVPNQALFISPFKDLTLVTDAGQIWDGSFIFTASSFIPTVKKWFRKSAWSCGTRRGRETHSMTVPSTKKGPIYLEMYLKWVHVYFVTQLVTRLTPSSKWAPLVLHSSCANPTTERGGGGTASLLEERSAGPSPSMCIHLITSI